MYANSKSLQDCQPDNHINYGCFVPLLYIQSLYHRYITPFRMNSQKKHRFNLDIFVKIQLNAVSPSDIPFVHPLIHLFSVNFKWGLCLLQIHTFSHNWYSWRFDWLIILYPIVSPVEMQPVCKIHFLMKYKTNVQFEVQVLFFPKPISWPIFPLPIWVWANVTVQLKESSKVQSSPRLRPGLLNNSRLETGIENRRNWYCMPSSVSSNRQIYKMNQWP